MQSDPLQDLVADTRNNFPIMAKTNSANREMTEQNIRDIIEPPIAEPSGHGEPLAEISYPPQSQVETPRENPSDSVELSTINLNIVDDAAGQPIEHLTPFPLPSDEDAWSTHSGSSDEFAYRPRTSYPGRTPPSFWSELPD
jgi:hypothetical protein